MGQCQQPTARSSCRQLDVNFVHKSLDGLRGKHRTNDEFVLVSGSTLRLSDEAH